MRGVGKVVKTQQSVTVGAVTKNKFTIANKKQRICKNTTTLCVHAEISVFVKKHLKCVWCGIDTYFVCRFFPDSKKKPIPFH